MLSRRTVALGLAAAPLAACGSSGSYRDAATSTWRLIEPNGPGLPARALVHAATLAANSHNTQPWRFAVEGQAIRIQPDFTRRTPVVDPDDHHLFASLGCAAETLLQAAPHYGWRGQIESFDRSGGVRLALERTARPDGGLAPAIPRRASTRGDYDGRPAPVAVLQALQRAGPGTVDTVLITDGARLEQATEFIVRGNATQVRSPAFRRELKAWIRFDGAEAARHRDGLYAASSGNPTLPRALGALAFDLAFTEAGETDKIVRQMRSSAGLAVFSAGTNDPRGWLEAGRAYTRFALTAEMAGLRTAFLNQPVEDAATRGPFAAWLGTSGRRPDLVVRFGQGPGLPRSLRRPVRDVLSA
ncbi:MAG: hypothetical protein A2790_07135 [Phenylobacterium sp. RIFCSPHIGHO2_01_FULL_69_31]|uniref:Acg family FMN-binding oxidoreductase n=1 Tax=Phenylobacterium sp. RIFCSPHIGHO2_01_FULL_69_31 TaxID=1801944 RepID=UPI0008B05919|nr:hypothetical protein [Phenylobacterium sp. RIFCSPHIGHO2_01_FULL_69_31]OHB29677.1 MAG: hypothetical protein A2790_07135 [Phenylobacterium sp. RIFCSPHIGHO2_01_FULL_69_31]